MHMLKIQSFVGPNVQPWNRSTTPRRLSLYSQPASVTSIHKMKTCHAL